MLLLKIARYVLSSERNIDHLKHLLFGALVLLLSVMVCKVKYEDIKCFSEQSIKAGEYVPDEIDTNVEEIRRFRDVEHEKYNSVLLVGDVEASYLVSQIHKNARELPNRTKGYDVCVPPPAFFEKMQYFLVVHVEKSEESSVVLRNRGWQVNSDILSLFKNRLKLVAKSDFTSFFLPNLVFNEIAIATNENEMEKPLGAFWNINNLYSHSLGVYFYWVVGEKAVFLSSNALLVILAGVLLLFLEFASGGRFECRLWGEKLPALLCSLLSPGASLLLRDLSFFECFILYFILVVTNFCAGAALAGAKIAEYFLLPRRASCKGQSNIRGAQYPLKNET